MDLDNKYKILFDELVHSSLYGTYNLDTSLLEEIAKEISKENHLDKIMNDLTTNKTYDNYFAYQELIKIILDYASFSYEQIEESLDSDYGSILFNKLTINEVKRFIKKREKLSSNEVDLINSYLEKYGIKVKDLLEDEYLDKFPDNSLILSYQLLNLSKSSLLIKKLTKQSLTEYVKLNSHTFSRFKKFLDKDLDLILKINDHSLSFKENENKKVLEFITENPKLIFKFNEKYLELLDSSKLIELLKRETISGYLLTTLVAKGANIEEAYTLENISKCFKNSINEFPTSHLSNSLVDKVIHSSHLLNRFTDYVILYLVNSFYTDEDKVTLLRNSLFLSDLNKHTIELIINSLPFKSLFNMIQNHSIFDNIQNLNPKVTCTDKIFVKGFLDSPILVYKSNYEFIINLLELLDKDYLLEYLSFPYISNKLNSNAIYKLLKDNNIDINEIIENPIIFDKLSSLDMANYINEIWKKKINLKIMTNKKVLKKVLGLEDNTIDSLNFEEINYLFESIRTKDILSIQEHDYTVLTYKAIIACYQTLGIKKTLSFIIDGNKDINLEDTKKTIEQITYYELLTFRNNNYTILQNIDKKIVDNLNVINSFKNKKEFELEISKNDYLKSIILLMTNSRYISLTELVNVLYDYKQNESNEARKDLRNFCNGFVNYYINIMKEMFKRDLEKKARTNFKLKKNVENKEYNHLKNNFIKNLKIKIFINALQDKQKNKYLYAFKKDLDLENLERKFKLYLQEKFKGFFEDIDLESIINYVLVPLSKEKFDDVECLGKLGIEKPKDYDLYIRNIKDINAINDINNYISEIKKQYSVKELIEILNYICYGVPLTFKIDSKTMKNIKDLQYKSYEIIGDISLDKINCSVTYTNVIEYDDLDKIIEYINYQKLVNEIITNTLNYINRHLDNESIKMRHLNTIVDAIELKPAKYSFNEKNFETKKRTFTLKDIERIFNGYDLNNHNNPKESLINLLEQKKAFHYIALGYYEGLVDDFGYLLSNLNDIATKCEELNINIEDLDLLEVRQLLIKINHENILNGISEETINLIYSDSYYFDIDVQQRIKLANKIYEQALLKNEASIPMISVQNQDYSLSTLDYHDENNYTISLDSDYHIGSNGSDLLAFSILSKDGIVLVIRDFNNNIVGRINGVRNGNTIFLTEPVLKTEIDIQELIYKFATNVVKYTEDSDEPIEVVVINNYDFGLLIDSSTCEYINNPIDINSFDYKSLKEQNLLLGYDINSFYKNGKTSIVYSKKAINRDTLISYSATPIYKRIRNDISVISMMSSEKYIRKINSIVNKVRSLNNEDLMYIDIERYKNIYLGDDFVILIDLNNEVTTYVLPFDERASLEVKDILNKITCNLVNYSL